MSASADVSLTATSAPGELAAASSSNRPASSSHTASTAPSNAWLFGRSVDLWTFGGSAALALAIVAVAAWFGVAEESAPEWMWVGCIVLVDVAHVWSTVFRVYLDGDEVRRRPWLYLGLPVPIYGIGVLAYAFSPRAFWTLLAYLAVYHFVRQQYGWVALYGRRGRVGRVDRFIDTAAIYAATLYPLLWWHTHLPRRFVWFAPNDFLVGLDPWITSWVAPLYWGALALFVARQLQLVATGQAVQVGKVVVVVGTWACWWLGIVVYNGDLAFTATNVLIHGIPYMVLTYRYGHARAVRAPASRLARVLRWGVPGFVGVVLLLAFIEEALWDRWVWHDRAWLFGAGVEVETVTLALLVPLLALPQATHYALDGFIWKARSNPQIHHAFARTTG